METKLVAYGPELEGVGRSEVIDWLTARGFHKVLTYNVPDRETAALRARVGDLQASNDALREELERLQEDKG